MKRIIFCCLIAILSRAIVCAQSSSPLLKEGTKVSIPINKKGTKALDIFVKSITYRDSTDRTCQADVILVFTSRNEKIHFGTYKDFWGQYQEDYRFRFNMFNIDGVLQKNDSFEKKVSIWLKQGIYRDSILTMDGKKLMYIPPYDSQEFIQKEKVTMEFTDKNHVCVYVSFRLFGEDGYQYRTRLLDFGYKLKSKSNAFVAENNFGDLTNGKVSVYKYALKNGGYSVCKITEGQAFMFEFYRSKK